MPINRIIYEINIPLAVGMGSHTLFCRGYTLRRSNDHFSDTLQATGFGECRHNLLYLMALSALDEKAIVESTGRIDKYQTHVDNVNADDS